MSGEPLELSKPHDEVPKRDSLDRALAGLVKRARRLQMSSVEGEPDFFNKSLKAAKDDGSQPLPVQTKPKPGGTLSRLWRRLRKSEACPRTPRGRTAHLAVPPPPPPTPRYPQALELCLALEQAQQLMDDYRQTDELADRLLEQATEINRELLLQDQRQRHARLVCDLEAEYSEDYMYILLEATRAEFESVESQQLPHTRPSSTK